MTFSTSAGYPRSIITMAAKISSSDGTTVKTLVTAGSDGAVITSLNATLSDTAARYLQLYLSKGGVDYLLASVYMVPNAGMPGYIASSIFGSVYLPSAAYDADGNKCYRLASGDSLKIGLSSALAAGKEVHVTGYGVAY